MCANKINIVNFYFKCTLKMVSYVVTDLCNNVTCTKTHWKIPIKNTQTVFWEQTQSSRVTQTVENSSAAGLNINFWNNVWRIKFKDRDCLTANMSTHARKLHSFNDVIKFLIQSKGMWGLCSQRICKNSLSELFIKIALLKKCFLRTSYIWTLHHGPSQI